MFRGMVFFFPPVVPSVHINLNPIFCFYKREKTAVFQFFLVTICNIKKKKNWKITIQQNDFIRKENVTDYSLVTKRSTRVSIEHTL